jgi:hypothetical protein
MFHTKPILRKAWSWGKLMLLCFCPAIILKIKQRISKYKPFIMKELRSSAKMPLRKRFWAWKRGFLSDSIALYGLNNDNVHRYLADMPYRFAHPLNGMFSNLIDDKLNVYFALGAFREYLPVYYLLILRNEIITLDSHRQAMPLKQTKTILDLCREKGRLAMKPLAGSLGEGFLMMSFDGIRFHLNGNPIEERELQDKCRSLDHYIVTEYIQQHPYAQALFPHTTNTLRILTMRDYSTHESFIACVRQRIGRITSIPVDNFHRGGMVCAVDDESGELGPGVSIGSDRRLIWHEGHPDTGVPIAGAFVSN